MPVQPTYPGVYIEEIPSGVRTITGVATSITAFVGRAFRGPVNDPVTINSFGDFERSFGGLWADSSLGYAVRDFYLNGGGQAIIVRLYHPFFASDADRTKAVNAAKAVADAAKTAAAAPGSDADSVKNAARTAANGFATEPEKTAADVVAKAAEASAAINPKPPANTVRDAAVAATATAAPVTNAGLTVDTLQLQAASPGSWGNQLQAMVDHDVAGPDPNLFNLRVRAGSAGSVEVFRNVAVAAGHPRLVDKVLAAESKLVRAVVPLPATPPAETSWVTAGQPASDGGPLVGNDVLGSPDQKQGLFALEKADLFNLLCIPPYRAPAMSTPSVITQAAVYCETRRAMLLVDPPSAWVRQGRGQDRHCRGSRAPPARTRRCSSRGCGRPIPLRDNQLRDFAPCGAVAGVFARTDAQRGVWKAPAGHRRQRSPACRRSSVHAHRRARTAQLNPLGINCLRTFPVVGPRGLGRAHAAAAPTGWPTSGSTCPSAGSRCSSRRASTAARSGWSSSRTTSRSGRRSGSTSARSCTTCSARARSRARTPREAYFVKCDKETTTQNDINLGIVNILVGFAPLKPAEFVVIQIQQIAGQIET